MSTYDDLTPRNALSLRAVGGIALCAVHLDEAVHGSRCKVTMNVLVVEDDELLGTGLLRVLEQSGYVASLANDGNGAKAALDGGDFDLLLLDLGLPDIDGLDILRSLRRQRRIVPVLVLTARDGVEQRVAALDAGADDYLEKPFDLRELEARVRALLRRSHVMFGQEARLGALAINPYTREARIDGELLAVPAREFEVLEILVINAGKVVTKARIAQRLTASNDDIGDNAIEVYVHRLRRRLGPHGLNIRTVRGVGYLIETS
ncbi:MAG: response regulator transcription factor [Gammaproteobacteria bacterium]